jgi:hypothetical protein
VAHLGRAHRIGVDEDLRQGVRMLPASLR